MGYPLWRSLEYAGTEASQETAAAAARLFPVGFTAVLAGLAVFMVLARLDALERKVQMQVAPRTLIPRPGPEFTGRAV